MNIAWKVSVDYPILLSYRLIHKCSADWGQGLDCWALRLRRNTNFKAVSELFNGAETKLTFCITTDSKHSIVLLGRACCAQQEGLHTDCLHTHSNWTEMLTVISSRLSMYTRDVYDIPQHAFGHVTSWPSVASSTQDSRLSIIYEGLGYNDDQQNVTFTLSHWCCVLSFFQVSDD
jgi:hypothetical protein